MPHNWCARTKRRINSFLEHVDVGDFVVYGNLEAYSCALCSYGAAAAAAVAGAASFARSSHQQRKHDHTASTVIIAVHPPTAATRAHVH